jgi:hypothetical protein
MEVQTVLPQAPVQPPQQQPKNGKTGGLTDRTITVDAAALLRAAEKLGAK